MEETKGQGGQVICLFFGQENQLLFLKYCEEKGDRPPNGGGPLSRGLGVIRKDTGEVPPAELGVLLELLLHIRSPSPSGAAYSSPEPLATAGPSERSSWGPFSPHPIISYLMGRQVFCLLGLDSCCAQLPLALVQMHSGCQATGGRGGKEVFLGCLASSGLSGTWFRDCPCVTPLCCVPNVIGPAPSCKTCFEALPFPD